jgi:nicotinic acid mononucleotide adenylyltransferase
MLEAADTPRVELSPHLERMHMLKRLLAELPVPADCAQETHQSIDVMMMDVLNTFEAYRLDPTIDTQPAVTRAQATLQLIWADIDAFYVRAEATYDAINAGQ